MDLTCDYKVTYGHDHGRGLQGPGRPDAEEPARRAFRAGRSDPERARGGVADVALRRDEAPQALGGGGVGDHQASRSREAPLPQPRPDPGRLRALGQQVLRVLGRRAQRAQKRHRGGAVMSEREAWEVVDGRAMSVFEIYIKTTPERLWEAIVDPELRKKYTFGG